MNLRTQLFQLQEPQLNRSVRIDTSRKWVMTFAFSNHMLLSAFFVICLLAFPESGLADDNHDWKASASFRGGGSGGSYQIIAEIGWNPPPVPSYAWGMHYNISHEGGGANVISWGNSGGIMRIWQGKCTAAEFAIIFEQTISKPHSFSITLTYYTVYGDYSISHSFIWLPAPLEATEPYPADGTVVKLSPGTPLLLTWTQGRKATTHDVYFSESFQAVNEGTEEAFLGNLNGFPSIGAPESDFATELFPSRTYYWRIDEVDDDGTKHRGDVWSFWIKPPIPITDPNLICWWAFDLYEGDRVIDWSGYDNDGTVAGQSQLVDGYDGFALRSTTDGDFVACSLDQAGDWAAGTVAFWIKPDTAGQDAWSGLFAGHFSSSGGFEINTDGGNPGNYQVDPDGLTFGTIVTEWTHLALTFEGAVAKLYYNGSWIESGILEDTTFNQFALGTNRNMANSFFGAFDDLRIYDCALTENEIKQVMRIKPLAAWDPSPASGSVPTIQHVTPLTWSPGDGASQHDIYFGTHAGSVAAANTSDTSGIYRGRQNLAAYVPTVVLQSGQTYYWRVDEIDNLNGNTPPKGDIWSFTIRPETACRPYPSNGCKLREQNATLTWMPGSTGVLHDVYFGTDFDQVKSADASDASGVYRGQTDQTAYTPGQLDRGRDYYWRVDELTGDGAMLHQGNVWSFTVVNVETVDYQLSSGQDDAYAYNEDGQNEDRAYLRVGATSYAKLPYYASGMVFRNVNIPRGSEIVSARLEIRSYNSHLTDTVYGKITAEATDDADVFGSTRKIDSLPTTNAAVVWDIEEPWSEDTWYASPDIAGVIQEIIARRGWLESNSLAIIWSTRVSEGGNRMISSFDRGSDYAPMLEITYIPKP